MSASPNRTKTQTRQATKAKKVPVEKIQPKGPRGLSSKQIAHELKISPRQFRYFLREHDLGVGTGNRYDFTPAQAKKLIAIYQKELAQREV